MKGSRSRRSRSSNRNRSTIVLVLVVAIVRVVRSSIPRGNIQSCRAVVVIVDDVAVGTCVFF